MGRLREQMGGGLNITVAPPRRGFCWICRRLARELERLQELVDRGASIVRLERERRGHDRAAAGHDREALAGELVAFVGERQFRQFSPDAAVNWMRRRDVNGALTASAKFTAFACSSCSMSSSELYSTCELP